MEKKYLVVRTKWFMLFFFFKQKTAYVLEARDWSSDVCSSDLLGSNPLTWNLVFASISLNVGVFPLDINALYELISVREREI